MKLPKVYEPNQYESDIYELWEKGGAFKPNNRGGDGYFSLVAPPPNANAPLHIGFGLTMALEDIAVRYNRLKGKSTLFIPGADHAGFETQAVYEKQLAKQGKSRFDFNREELYEQIWDFVAQNRQLFEAQFRRLGGGVDWDYFTFTLDDKVINRAYVTFKKMWQENLIYRGERLVNFCTFHGTAFADIEVEYEETDGHLWYIRYPLSDGIGEVVVATTRPETMLGDVAVAVHPEDEKLSKFVGKTVKLPLTEREIPVLADNMVDRHFGTGAVKITPAHDPNDFDLAERHDLPKVTVINHEGKMTADVPENYRGLTVDEARKKVVEDLKNQGFLVKVEDHRHSVGHCYKCHNVIQPLLREQWFVDMQPLASRAIDVLEKGEIEFYPQAKKNQLIGYLKGLKDWNISRQIAWGIPIPAFQNINDPDDWIYDETINQEIIEKDGKSYKRDPDVFDTWFSSSSWPYVTLDFPNSKDFKQFYPLSLMETGGEILYPWVSRMIMMGLYVTDKIPFKNVYIHGYVMAEDGSKMSKSIGNTVDLIKVIDQYGSDAMRMGIVAGRTPAVNRGYDHRKVEEARNFANKVWNIARYIEDKLSSKFEAGPADPNNEADHWILTKLQQLTEAVGADLDNYRFAEAYDKLYHFVWDEFADWYIEVSKIECNPSVLGYVLESILIILHPYAPFVTETIWQTLKWEAGSILAVRAWPKITESDQEKAAKFDEIKDIVSEIRYLSNELNLKKPVLSCRDKLFTKNYGQLIKHLTSVREITGSVKKGLKLTSSTQDFILEISEADLENYKDKLVTKVNQQEKFIKQITKRLSNKAYLAGAPPELVEESRQQLVEAHNIMKKLLEEQKKRF